MFWEKRAKSWKLRTNGVPMANGAIVEKHYADLGKKFVEKHSINQEYDKIKYFWKTVEEIDPNQYAKDYYKMLVDTFPQEELKAALLQILEDNKVGIGQELKEGQERGREEARKRLIIADDPFLNECIVAKKEIDKVIATPLNDLKQSQDPNFTGGRKFDGGKLQYGLVPPLALRETVKVLTFGAEKYEIDNWKNVPDSHRRYFDAAQRHLWAYKEGEVTDPESGVNHLAHAICCIMFILDLDESKK